MASLTDELAALRARLAKEGAEEDRNQPPIHVDICEFSADGNRVSFQMVEQANLALTLRQLIGQPTRFVLKHEQKQPGHTELRVLNVFVRVVAVYDTLVMTGPRATSNALSFYGEHVGSVRHEVVCILMEGEVPPVPGRRRWI